MTTTAAPPGQDREDGVTVVLPAYREEANLTQTVEDMLSTLDVAGEPHQVVIVNDGSPDATGEVADSLAARYPERIIVVHHPVNQGYGAAVRTGIKAALEQTDSRRLFLTHSTASSARPSYPTSSGRLTLNGPTRSSATARSAPTPCSARSTPRSGAGHASSCCGSGPGTWTALTNSSPARPGRRTPACQAGTISPELLLRAKDRGARVPQRPVEHFPRQHGEQTGEALCDRGVLAGLVKLWWEHTCAAWPGRAVRCVRHPDDPVLAAVTLTAVVASIAAYWYFASTHATLDYPDAVSRLLVARRVIDGPTLASPNSAGSGCPFRRC